MSSSRNFILRYAPDRTFSSRKMKKLPTVGGGNPSHTLPPLSRYAPSGLVASLPRKDCAPPQMFWLITPLSLNTTPRVRTGVSLPDFIPFPRIVRGRARGICEFDTLFFFFFSFSRFRYPLYAIRALRAGWRKRYPFYAFLFTRMMCRPQ